MGLLCGESRMIRTSTVFDLIHLCDRQTDEWTDGQAIAYMLSRVKNQLQT